MLTPKLRIIRGACGLQWIVQSLKRVTPEGDQVWGGIITGVNRDFFCSTKAALLARLRERLLEEHLEKLGFYRPQQKQVFDAKRGRMVKRSVVSKEALVETEAARAKLAAGDVTAFGINQAAWAAVENLPDHFNSGL